MNSYLLQVQAMNPVVEGRPATADVVKGKEPAPVIQLATNNSLQNRVGCLKILFEIRKTFSSLVKKHTLKIP